MAVGRPREFDVNEALEKALRVFWMKGYEGASLTDLTRAMGINRPSLYAAFGNKEELFRKVIDHYAERQACYMIEAAREPTARRVVERLLRGSIDVVTDTSNPRGCLLVQSALACGEEAEAVREELTKRRISGEVFLRSRLERAKTEGDLPPESDPADLARYVMIISQGLSVEATNGATREELTRAVDLAMNAWPT